MVGMSPAGPAYASIIDPRDCDEHGTPLDWLRCRGCGGPGIIRHDHVPGRRFNEVCPTCDGHGCLKAAALARLLLERGRDDHVTDVEDVYSEHGSFARATCSCGWESAVMDDSDAHDAAWMHREHDPHPAHGVARCEDCNHLMGEGTWEGDINPHQTMPDKIAYVIQCFRLGKEPALEIGVHYSRCDEKCRHGGHMRMHNIGPSIPEDTWVEVEGAHPNDPPVDVQAHVKFFDVVHASWRQVDVRVGEIGRKGLGERFDPTNVLHVRPWDLRP